MATEFSTEAELETVGYVLSGDQAKAAITVLSVIRNWTVLSCFAADQMFKREFFTLFINQNFPLAVVRGMPTDRVGACFLGRSPVAQGRAATLRSNPTRRNASPNQPS